MNVLMCDVCQCEIAHSVATNDQFNCQVELPQGYPSWVSARDAQWKPPMMAIDIQIKSGIDGLGKGDLCSKCLWKALAKLVEENKR